MQVIFIHHSCFLVEVDEKVLIFDWFDGDRVEGYHFGGVLYLLTMTARKIFSTHRLWKR